jgi:molecular chaperone GrpE
MANKEDEKNLEEESENQEEVQDDLSDEEKLAKMEEELEKKDEELREYVAHTQRLQADFENFKKQSEKQNQNIIKYANENLINNILDSYEDMGRALDKSNSDEDLREGLELIYEKLTNTLKKEGLEEIPTKGEKFDPFKHEALMVENNPDFENGEIIEELMKGYTLKDKVIRYSKVKVCKK